MCWYSLLRVAPVIVLALCLTAQAWDPCNTHEDCPLEQYCSKWETQGNNHTCIPCVNCHDPGSSNEEPVTLPCPLWCNCSSNDDCGPEAFCSESPLTYPAIQQCFECQHNCKFSNSFECPEWCRCSSSEDCPEDHYCSTQGGSRQTCVRCDSEDGCVDDWIVSDQEEECESLCPSSWVCNTHEDCGGDQWCSMNHHCHSCKNETCWTRGRITGIESLSNSEVPDVSVDLACPSTCCDWESVPYFTASIWTSSDFPLETIIGRCDSSLQIDAYWTSGFLHNWTVSQALESGTKCRTSRHKFENGYPRVVTSVDCTDVLVTCEVAERTIAYLSTSRQSDEQVFLDPDAFPVTHVFDNRSEGCTGLNYRKAARSFFVAFLIIFVICCITPCLWDMRTECRYGSGEAGSRPADDATVASEDSKSTSGSIEHS